MLTESRSTSLRGFRHPNFQYLTQGVSPRPGKPNKPQPHLAKAAQNVPA